ncbi:MAG: DUF1501 domain-containing protein [Actinobacteria bacterium]|nr:DUF1501 domain-containing protein [Actinomycetota bacterium]
MNDDAFDDQALRRLSVPAALPGGLSRRRFLQLLGGTAGLAAGGSVFGSTLEGLRAFAAPPIGPGDGVLVLIALDGGNDGLNTLVPYGDSRYYQLRTRIGIPQAQVLPIDGTAGFHPSLPKLKARYDLGQVAVVRGVGYQPPDLSHFTSMGIVMNGWGGGAQPGGATGWIGRYLDGLPNAANESLLGAVVGTSVPLHMVGSVARACGLPQSIGGAFGVDRSDPSDVRMFDAISSFSATPTNLGQWGDTVATVARSTLDLASRIQPAYQGTWPTSRLSRQLVLAARLINTDLGLRVIGTATGGFDNHTDQPSTHAALLADLDNSIDLFFQTLSPSFQSRVTVMTFSEFGRRPGDNNSRGTDHGTAGVQLLVGEQVNGGLHGQQPSLTALDRNGNLVHQVDFRRVYATVLEQWLKADATQVLGYGFTKLDLFRAGGPGVVAGMLRGDGRASNVQGGAQATAAGRAAGAAAAASGASTGTATHASVSGGAGARVATEGTTPTMSADEPAMTAPGQAAPESVTGTATRVRNRRGGKCQPRR